MRKTPWAVWLSVIVFSLISTLLMVSEISRVFGGGKTDGTLVAFLSAPGVQEELKESVRFANKELQQSLAVDVNSVDSVRRGILAYFPPGIPRFISELKWFYLSIGYMRAKQPSHIKTDLILFTEPSYVDELSSTFSCAKEVRKSFQDKETCIVLAHEPLRKRKVPEGSKPSPLIDYSNYVDSMLILAEFKHADAYDILIRSDLDTFITPGFSDWTLPGKTALVAGRGAYGSHNSNNHLRWVAEKKLGLKDAGMTNLGSTWYGRTSVMLAAAKLTLAIMSWLDTQEFSEYEKGPAGVDGWPYVFAFPVDKYYFLDIGIGRLFSSMAGTSP